MSETITICEKFKKLYDRISDLRIAIYGIGGHTKSVLLYLEDKRSIIGLLHNKPIDKPMYGLRVYEANEIIGIADVIVIIARDAVIQLIYKRIKHLIKKGIKIYNVNGENLVEKFFEWDGRYIENPYWNTSIDELKEAIRVHDVISFDMFDTLLMRRIIRPHDELGYVREKQLNISRMEVVSCLRYASELNKEIYILSDMYFSSTQLRELLTLNGIEGYSEIIVSCEYDTTKEDGALFDVLKSKANGKCILHIGDNEKSDVENARAHGIDAYYIMNAYDMLLNSELNNVLIDVPTVSDNLIIGEFVANILNNPFALNENKGRVAINDMRTLALYFVPIVNSFLQWLVKEIWDLRRHSIILFLARDGYLIKKLYDWVNEEFKLDLPPSVYFPASRTAVSDEYEMYHKNYVNYAKELGIFNYQHIFVYDLVTKGTTVSRLAKIFDIKLELLCFASFNIDEKFTSKYTHSMLGDNSFYFLPFNFLRYYELLEIMSIPKQTQFLYINDELQPIYASFDSENQKQWERLTEFQDSLLEQIYQITKVNPDWIYNVPCIKTADNVLGLIASKYAIVADNVKNAFIFDSPPESIPQTQWWDRLVH